MPHPYSAQADLEHVCGGPAGLVQVFDRGLNVADATAMAVAISDADSIIDAFVNKQWLVPLDIVPPIIRQLSARIAVYTVRANARMVDPETHGKAYEADLQLLKDLRDCVITIGVDPGPTKASARIDASSPASDLKERSRERLRGFS